MNKVTALVPMKHHSQRVPRKNFRKIGGKPLFHHILSTLEDVPGVDEIVVDTDSPVIKQGLSTHFPQVSILDRPENLCGDEVSMNRILAYDLSKLDGEFFLQTHSTNPLLQRKTIEQAIAVFFNNMAGHDSLFSVTRLFTRLWSQDGEPINHDPGQLQQTQDLPPIYEENSCLYVFSKKSFQKRENRIGDTPRMYEIPQSEAWDIDTELDFMIAEYLIDRLKKSSR